MAGAWIAGGGVTPFYDGDGVTLYCGDVLEVLAELEEEVDLVVTSPPYNLGAQSGDYANMRDGYVEHADDLPDDVYVTWQRSVLSAVWSRLAPTGAVFYNHKPIIRDGVALLPTRLVPADIPLRQIIVWDRGVGMNWNASHFCPRHEWILLLARRGFRLTSRSASNPGDVWRLPIEQDDRGHPCPFPLALPLTAIGATSARVVLDPFAGTGTTLRAAKDLGRRAIGIELSERYCDIAVRRLGQGVLGLWNA